jgi:indolepyruvate ferredoxin oxidoreductase
VARLEALLAPLAEAEARAGGDGRLARAAEVQLYRLLAPKDVYEVGRLWARDPLLAPGRALGGRAWLRLHVPFLPGRDHRGRPRRVDLPEGLARPVFRLLAGLRRLRGTWADPFRGGAEAKAAAALLEAYGADLVRLSGALDARTLVAARRVVDWPSLVRGYGPVRAASAEKAEAERQAAWAWMERRVEAKAPTPRKVAA